MNEKETFKEKWQKADKKLVFAFIAGIAVGTILVKASTKVEIRAANSEGYAKGASDVIRGIIGQN